MNGYVFIDIHYTHTHMYGGIYLYILLFLVTESCILFLVTKSCPILWDLIDYSLPGSSVHEISQTRILEWIAISFSRGSYQPGDQTWVSCIGRQILYHWAHTQRVCVIKCLINLTLTPSQSQLQLSNALDVYRTSVKRLTLKSVAVQHELTLKCYNPLVFPFTVS